MRRQTLILFGWLTLLLGTTPGCFVMKVGVSNPTPNLPRIAVIPFVNLSPERSVDGRRFAEAYFTELQKVPGFQVIPVGVVESAMHDHQINLDTPRDLQKLIEVLDVDGVCYGAVTEYNPYYPPRLGMQISWYTNSTPDFQPGIPLDPEARKHQRHTLKMLKKSSRNGHSSYMPEWMCFPGFPTSSTESATEIEPAIRGQNSLGELQIPPRSAGEPSPRELSTSEQASWELALAQVMRLEESDQPRQARAQAVQSTGSEANQNPSGQIVSSSPISTQISGPVISETSAELKMRKRPNLQQLPGFPGESLDETFSEMPDHGPSNYPQPGLPLMPGENPSPGIPFPQPYMSYTRVFDGADADFTASLKNYLELSGDQRSGGWTGYLHRSEDFIRFCMHRMIVEMMQLHGGESQRRIVFISRKYH